MIGVLVMQARIHRKQILRILIQRQTLIRLHLLQTEAMDVVQVRWRIYWW